METPRTSNWPLHYVPSAKYLMGYDVSNSDVEIENGLSRLDDQNLFLSASIAFLQKQLQQKLHSKGYASTATVRKICENSFSDMLLIETCTERSRRERYFIKLKNIDKYEEILRSEASTPVRSLSLDQILPKPKKGLRSNASTLFEIFKAKPSGIIINPNVKRSHSIFNLLRREKKGDKPHQSVIGSSVNSSSSSLFLRYKDDEIKKERNRSLSLQLPKIFKKEQLESLSDVSSSCSSIAMIRLKLASSFIKPPVVLESSSGSSVSVLNDLRRNKKKTSERDSFKNFSMRSHQSVPPLDLESEDRKPFRSYQSTPIHRSRNFESMASTSTNNSNRLRKLESKLSLNIEDETDTEDELENSCSSFCTNFTDELKSKVSPGELERFLKRYLRSYEEHYNGEKSNKSFSK